MSRALLKLLFIYLTTAVNFQNLKAQDKDSYKILFIGHAYGSHSEIDKKLDRDVIKILEDENYNEFVFGGDFIYNCNDDNEFDNLIEDINEINVKLTIGNHDDCEKVKTFIKNKYLSINQKQILNNTIILYLNTSIKNQYDLDNLIAFTERSIKDYENVIIFCHQVIFSKNDFYLRTNSRKFYDYGVKFYNYLKETYLGSKKKIYIFTGDIGAFDYTPHSFYEKNENFYLFASGIGNSFYKNGVSIDLNYNGKITAKFINLKNSLIEDPKKYNKIYNQFYQFPKLTLFYLKKHILILVLILGSSTILLNYSKFKKWEKYKHSLADCTF